MRRPATVRSAAVLAATLLGGASIVSGCGVSADDQPRTLARTATSQPKREPATAGTTTAYLYLVANGKIVASNRDVESREPAKVLGALFDDVTDADHAADLISLIPRGTTLRSAVRSGSTLTVDLSKEFDNLVGSARGQATAQIVLTATELGGVEEVTFLVDGKASKVFSPTSGDTNRVSACDYLPLLASDDDMRADTLPAASVRHLTALRTALTSHCPSSGTNRTSSSK